MIPSKSKKGLFSDLLEEVLRDQQDLSAVERFSIQHEGNKGHSQARYYRDLIPLSKPGSGEQFAFEVDLDSCTGCKACVTACHIMNGLDDFEVWREVGTLVGGTLELPVVQHITSACHHCLEPGCLTGCPVKAYEKDVQTGIVKHLDDQCIGCQYCVLKCPYDVPKYHKNLGIVRKCDMCSGRLSTGEAPACVQSCPNKAIRIIVVNKLQVMEDCESGRFLPGAPAPNHTLPSTYYKTERALPRNMWPGDYHLPRPQPAHMPLCIMLVFTQMSLGLLLIQSVLGNHPDYQTETTAWKANVVAVFLTGLVGIGVSVLHLGRPLLAFRSFLGLRTSWMSREIILFGAFILNAGILAFLAMAPKEKQMLPWATCFQTLTVIFGVLGVFCSAMIYHDTPRPHWTLARTGRKFLLTTLGLGICGIMFSRVLILPYQADQTSRDILNFPGNILLPAMLAVGLLKMVDDTVFLFHLLDKRNTPFKKSVHLLLGPLLQTFAARLVLGLLGGVAIPLILTLDSGNPRSHGAINHLSLFLTLSFFSFLGGELLERKLFFQAVVPPKMPGAVAE